MLFNRDIILFIKLNTIKKRETENVNCAHANLLTYFPPAVNMSSPDSFADLLTDIRTLFSSGDYFRLVSIYNKTVWWRIFFLSFSLFPPSPSSFSSLFSSLAVFLSSSLFHSFPLFLSPSHPTPSVKCIFSLISLSLYIFPFSPLFPSPFLSLSCLLIRFFPLRLFDMHRE